MKQINVGTSKLFASTTAQVPKEVIFKKPSDPGSLPRVTGVNIIQKESNLAQITSNLKDMGIEVLLTFYSIFVQGRKAIMLYCMTIHGQNVFVELPDNINVDYGDVQIHVQRPDVLQTSIQNTFRDSLKSILTGYVFICQGGIHYLRSFNDKPIIYGYDEPVEMQSFNIPKYSFILVPAVKYIKLVKPERFNTIEASIDIIDETKLVRYVFNRAGLISLLTIKGPITLFLPNVNLLKTISEKSPEELQAILLAHLVIGRIDIVSNNDPIISGVDSESKETMKKSMTEKFQSIAQNEIILNRVDGRITFISVAGSNKKIKISKTVRKYNGIIHVIDSMFTPVKKSFVLPERSDLDDVLTIFDINKATMEIRKAQYDINKHNQQQALKLIEFIAENSKELHKQIEKLSDQKGKKLIADSNEFMDLFYTRQIPCMEECIRMDDLAIELRSQNQVFDNILRQSNYLASLKVPFEEMLLNMSRIEQSLRRKDVDKNGK